MSKKLSISGIIFVLSLSLSFCGRSVERKFSSLTNSDGTQQAGSASTNDPSQNPSLCLNNVTIAPNAGDIFNLWMSATSAQFLSNGIITNNGDSGFYKVYVPNWNLYAEAVNQSFYFNIKNTTNPSGYPKEGSCQGNYIVADQADISDFNFPYFAGEFWLDQGENEFTIHHFCKLYIDNFNAQMDVCEEFNTIAPWGGTGCLECDGDSVSINASEMCFTNGEPIITGV